MYLRGNYTKKLVCSNADVQLMHHKIKNIHRLQQTTYTLCNGVEHRGCTGHVFGLAIDPERRRSAGSQQSGLLPAWDIQLPKLYIYLCLIYIIFQIIKVVSVSQTNFFQMSYSEAFYATYRVSLIAFLLHYWWQSSWHNYYVKRFVENR